MNAPSAYRIQQALAAWNSARQRLVSETSDPSADRDEIDVLLSQESEDVETILASLLRAAQHATDNAKGAAERVKAIRVRQNRYLARADSLRATAFAMMDVLERRKVELPDLTAWVRAPGRSTARITNADALTDEYVRIKREPNMDLITEHLNEGVVIDGAELANGMPSLVIRGS